MILWIALAIFAQFLNAVVSVLDKHLVSKTVLRPVSYAFYSGIFQFAYLALIPFGFILPENKYILLAILIGALFTFILVVLYKAIQAAEASRVIPLVGGMTSLFTFSLAYLFLGERLSGGQAAAFVFFSLGAFLLCSKLNHGKTTIIKGVSWAVLAAFLFAVYYVMTKFLFLRVDFMSGFILIQLGGFLGAAALVLRPANRKAIFSASGEVASGDRSTALLFVPTKLLGALSGIVIYYAISLGSVTVINSLQAVQYGFLLILAVIFSKKLPDFFKEQVGEKVLKRKILAVILIGLGLVAVSW